MHSTGSLLMTTLERIRTFLDEPSLDAKYSNDFLVRQVIEPEMVNVITALNTAREEPVLCKFHLDGIADNSEYVELPPNVGSIIRIAKLDANNEIETDIPKRDENDPRGAGWFVDGRELHFRPEWDTTSYNANHSPSGYHVWYIPSGDFNPHYSAAGGQLSGLNSLTLDSTPDVGGVDMRQSAYIGGILRVWGDSNTVVQERVITSYNADDKTVGFRSDFTAPIANGSTIRYEIVPEYMGHIWQAIAISSSINLGVARNISEKQMTYLKERFGMALQSASRLTKSKVDERSVHPENSVLYTMIQRIRWGLPEQVEKEMSNDYIMRYAIQPKLAEVMSMMSARSDSQIVSRHSLSLSADTEYYALPPCMNKVLRLTQLTTTNRKGLVSKEVRQRDDNDPNGNGWAIEGNRLSIRPYPSETTSSYSLWYNPSGDFLPHYANDGAMSNSGKTLTLSLNTLFSRLVGNIDKRVNAYVGATLRVFESDGSISERTITSHSAGNSGGTGTTTGTVTVTEAFSTTSGTVAYEIVPSWMSTIMSAVVTRSILELMALKGGVNESDLAILSESAKSSLNSAMTSVRERNAQEFVPNKDSALHMILEKTKTILSDVAKELDYSDDYIFRHGIVPEYSRVISRIQNTSSDYIQEKLTISLVVDQQYYEIPPCVGEITRIVKTYDDGRLKSEILPRGQYNSQGPNWSVEGNMLSFRPFPQEAEDVELWFIPSTDVKPHYAEDGFLNSTGTVLKLSASNGGWASQMLGDIDRREKAYQGSIVRILEHEGNIQERVINSHSAGSPGSENQPTLAFRSAFTEDGIQNQTVTYEILPVYFNAVSEAVAQGAAMNLLVSARRVTKAQHAMLLTNFKSAMKTAMDHFTFRQNRIPKKYERDTVDNKNRYGGLYGVR
tara:strand:+ start:659 stop:3352 length:2694 start_codon:yes stop_codon:yes gene_type:complete